MSNNQNAESGVKPAKKRHSYWWLWLILILAAFAGGVIAGLKLNTMPLPTEVKDKIYPVLESYIPGGTAQHTPDAQPAETPAPTAAPPETPAPEVTPEPVETPAPTETPAPADTAAPEITPEPAATEIPEITPAPAETPVPTWMTEVQSAVSETSSAGTAPAPAPKYIGVDAALDIALAHAELARNEAEVSSVYRTKDDDGTPVYQVVFRDGEITREYTIDAVSGEILSWMVSGLTYSETAAFASSFTGNDQTEAQAAAAAAPEMIGEGRAMEIALAHAGVKEADVLRSAVQLDNQADPARYTVEFRIADHRFDYQIEANTGEILRFELR